MIARKLSKILFAEVVLLFALLSSNSYPLDMNAYTFQLNTKTHRYQFCKIARLYGTNSTNLRDSLILRSFKQRQFISNLMVRN